MTEVTKGNPYSRAAIVLGNKRLRSLALIVAAEKNYDQGAFSHSCGTPSCALGHWAAHNRSRWTRTSAVEPMLNKIPLNIPGIPDPTWASRSVQSGVHEFALSGKREWDELFGVTGCGGAGTDNALAAAYLRKFARRREQQLRRAGQPTLARSRVVDEITQAFA